MRLTFMFDPRRLVRRLALSARSLRRCRDGACPRPALGGARAGGGRTATPYIAPPPPGPPAGRGAGFAGVGRLRPCPRGRGGALWRGERLARDVEHLERHLLRERAVM